MPLNDPLTGNVIDEQFFRLSIKSERHNFTYVFERELDKVSANRIITQGKNGTKRIIKKNFYFLFIEDLISYNKLSYSLFAGFNLTASFASINALWKSAFLDHTEALP
jgi:hypothetical protein